MSLSIERWGASCGRVLDSFLDLIYPTRCVACDRIGEGDLCPACRDSVTPIAPPYCPRCQEPEESDLCPGCRSRPPAFARARVVGIFEGALAEAIHALKYSRRERLAVPLADLLERAWEHETELHGAEAILPLPIHRKREGDRGFNQSSLLAEELSRRIGLPVLKGTLTRPVYKRPQVGLGRGDRLANVEGVFRVERPEAVDGRTLLLIDDVITTGATCHEAARTLLKAGAKEVCILALAREPYRKQ